MARLDGLGRRTLKILNSDDLVTAISASAIGGSKQQQKRSFARAATDADAGCFVVEGASVSKRNLADTISNSLGKEIKSTETDQSSLYRIVCESVRQLRKSFVVVYDAEDADRDVLSMLARVSAFAQRNGLVFRVVLIGDIPRLTKSTYYTGIRINSFVPRKVAEVAYDELSRQRYSVSQFTQHATS